MENWFVDSANAQQLRELVQERLQRKADCLGISHGRNSYGGFYQFLVGERVFVDVKIYVDSGGALQTYYLSLVDGPDAPAAHVAIADDIISLSGCSGDQYQRVLDKIRVRLTHGLVLPKIGMPYGYIENDTIIALWYALMREGGNVAGSLYTGASEFALHGYDLPDALLTRNDDPERYVQRCRELMRSGRVVELRERVVSHPGGLWYARSNTPWPHLFFAADDGQRPTMPSYTPYLLRFASDPPGDELPRTRKLVETYRQTDYPHENMSEYFARYT